MVVKINKVRTRLAILHNIPKIFFRRIESSEVFGDHLFPNWSNDIFAPTKLREKFEDVFNTYKSLTEFSDRELILKAFENSNQIERLCDEDPHIEIISLNQLHSTIQTKISDLFTHLYSLSLNYDQFNKYVDKTVFSAINDFKKANSNLSVCPICGLECFLNLKGQARLPLDHWLPQSIFPFTSVNFNNLLPLGPYCNQPPVKGARNILFNIETKTREKAFYPYLQHNGIKTRFSFKEEPKVGNETGIWEFSLEPNDPDDMDVFKNWRDNFNIETRYNSFIETEVLSMWKENYVSFINEDPKLNHAKDLISFKENLESWKASFKKLKYPGYRAHRSFINHLLNDVSESMLISLYLNFLSQEEAIKLINQKNN